MAPVKAAARQAQSSSATRPARADDLAVVQVDQGLEDRLHGPLVQDPAEVLHRRRGGMGDSRRAHAGLIDQRPAWVE
jgi:hypothetical protein